MRALALLTLLCQLGSELASPGAEAKVWYDVNILPTSGASTSYIHVVEWTKLPTQQSWVPGNGPLPLDPATAVGRAERILAEERNVTNFTVLRVLIERLRLDEEEVAAHGRPQDSLTNQWVLASQFGFGNTTDYNETVVMLLDGTCAVRKPAPEQWRDPRNAASGLWQGLTVPRTDGGPDNRRTKPRQDPWAQLRSPTFALPSVQRDPPARSYPRDPGADLLLARTFLATNGVELARATLRQIEITSFLPLEALQAQHLDIARNFHHWVEVFVFDGLERGTWSGSADVYILLDGKIIGATLPIPTN